MKLISNLATLSIAASLLLQSGNFVAATPFFNIPTVANHNNDASLDSSCKDFKITYPSSSGLSFEEGSKHFVAWQAPNGIKQVNITMIDNASLNNQVHIGTLDTDRLVTNEFPFKLPSQTDGDFHFHISGQGDSQFCVADSVAFHIKKRQQDTAATPATKSEEATSTDASATSTTSTLNKEDIDRILQEIQNSGNGQTASDTHANDISDGRAEKTNNNAAAASDNHKKQGFYAYIESLDQDHKKFIHKNKETETEAVTHKNDLASDDNNGSNSWFTNEDKSTHNNAAEKTWHSDDTNPYFTNDDQSTHRNDGASTKSI
ncbi:hypothetical protein BD408DRAFT_437664 [Parasitella parasitica]|nr:hypothetical protein BD408DRAFT_437664 [Parasitella parasitica]